MPDNLQNVRNAYVGLGIGSLTSQEELYVQRRTQGLEPLAAARAANYQQPKKAVAALLEREDINLAISYARELQRQNNILSYQFDRDDATAMYLEAHATAETSMEKIRAVDSLVKLHGLAAAEKKEITITSRKQMQQMGDDELLKLSGATYTLDAESYVEVKG